MTGGHTGGGATSLRWIGAAVLLTFHAVLLAALGAILFGLSVFARVRPENEGIAVVLAVVTLGSFVYAVFRGRAEREAASRSDGLEQELLRPLATDVVAKLAVSGVAVPDFDEILVTPYPACHTRWVGRRVLVLGYPLLRTLDEEELCAVIAHEAAHHAHGAMELHAALCRVRGTLERLYRVADAVVNEGNLYAMGLAACAAMALGPPLLGVYAVVSIAQLVLSPRFEDRCDRMAADAFGVTRLRDGLLRAGLVGAAWDALERGDLTPGGSPFVALDRALAERLSTPTAFEAVWTRRGPRAHPRSVRERAARLGVEGETVPALPEARPLIAGARRDRLDEDWWRSLEADWQSLAEESLLHKTGLEAAVGDASSPAVRVACGVLIADARARADAARDWRDLLDEHLAEIARLEGPRVEALVEHALAVLERATRDRGCGVRAAARMWAGWRAWRIGRSRRAVARRRRAGRRLTHDRAKRALREGAEAAGLADEALAPPRRPFSDLPTSSLRGAPPSRRGRADRARSRG